MNTTDETIHLMREYARNVECGITGPVRITRKFNEVTCQPCVDAEYLRRHNTNCDTDCTCAERGRIAAQAAPQTPEYRDMIAPDGRHVLTIRVDRHHDHTAVIVVTPMDTSLDRSFPTKAETDAYLAFLTEQVEANVPLWQIEHNAGVLTSTSAALDHIDVELIAAVNEVLDQAHAELAAERKTEQAAVADIMAGTKQTGGWHRYRQAHTRTGKPTSQPMDRILTTAVDGYIPRGQEATSVQLIALHKRGKVVLDWRQHGRTRRIAGAWITGTQPSQIAA